MMIVLALRLRGLPERLGRVGAQAWFPVRQIFLEGGHLMNFAPISFDSHSWLAARHVLLVGSRSRIGLRRTAVDAEGARAGIGTVGRARPALSGLLIAFSFLGAAAADCRRSKWHRTWKL